MRIRLMVAASAVLASMCGFGAVPKSDTVMVPRTDCPCAAVSLAGEWSVVRWPFKDSEETLVSPKCSDAGWERRAQPGKRHELWMSVKSCKLK